MATSREEILSEISKFVAANEGQIPGERTFATATRIKGSAWKGKHWARWSDAVREAGYDPNAMNQTIPEQDILDQRAGFSTKLAYFPVRPEATRRPRATPGVPVSQTKKERYGGMSRAAAPLW